MDLSGVAATLLPALEDIVFVGCQGADFLCEVASLGWGLESQVFLHGVAMYTEGMVDTGVLHAFLRKSVDGPEELTYLLSRALFRGLAVQTKVR